MFVALLIAAPVLAQPVKIAGPWKAGRLTVWAIEGPDSIHHPYLTVEQALATGRAIIHENNSQLLWIENRSDSDLFLQSGDLIKGGQQDRMIESDMILGAHDTSQSLHVFCVERGRSTKRGSEPIETFSSSHWMAPLEHLRLVARHDLTEQLLSPHVGGLTAPDSNELQLLQSLPSDLSVGEASAAQESIWNDVEVVQSDLTRALHDSVTRNASPTSLELALETRSLNDREEDYERSFEAIARDPAATGFVYAIDGQLIGADEYGSHSLFHAMWPKLVRSILSEAIGSHTELSHPENAQNEELTLDDVRQFVALGGSGKSSVQQIGDRTVVRAIKSDNGYAFETTDSATHAIVHRSVLKK